MSFNLFNLPEPNHEGKRAGIAQVEANAPDYWKEAALKAVKECATSYIEFTTDEVWAVLERQRMDRPPTPAAMGAVMLRASREGLVIKTGKYRVSRQKTNHARDVAVWRSGDALASESGKITSPDTPPKG